MKTPRLAINESRREVRINGKEIRLAPKEYDLLSTLKASGVLMNRETLLETIWPADRKRDTRTVDQHIARLRRKVGPGVVQTVHYFGYKLAAGV